MVSPDQGARSLYGQGSILLFVRNVNLALFILPLIFYRLGTILPTPHQHTLYRSARSQHFSTHTLGSQSRHCPTFDALGARLQGRVDDHPNLFPARLCLLDDIRTHPWHQQHKLSRSTPRRELGAAQTAAAGFGSFDFQRASFHCCCDLAHQQEADGAQKSC